MDLQRIDEWQPPLGKLTEYRPTPETMAHIAAVPPNDVPASLMQLGHIRTALEKQEQGHPWSPWIGFILDLQAPLDSEALNAAITTYVRRHDAMQTWFDTQPGPSGKATDTQLQRHLADPEQLAWQAEPAPEVATSTELRDLIWDRIVDLTGPLTWPSAYFATIEKEDGFILIHALDHAFSDGLSMALAANELLALYSANAAGQPITLPPVGSYLEYGQEERARAETLGLRSPALRVWLKALAVNGGRMPTSVIDCGLGEETSMRAARGSFPLLSPTDMASFAKSCKAAEATVSAGLFAAVGLTDHILGGRTRLVALNTIAGRSDPRYAMAQGWLINLVPVAYRFPRKPDWKQLSQRAGTSLRASQAAYDMPVRAILDFVGSIGGVRVGATAVPPIVSYLDLRALPILTHPMIRDLDVLVGPGMTGDVSLWIQCMPHATFVGISYPDNPTARGEVARYAQVLQWVMQQVADTGNAMPQECPVAAKEKG